MRRRFVLAAAAVALAGSTAATFAATPGTWALNALSEAARKALADYQLRDVLKISGTIPEFLVGKNAGGFIIANGRTLLDFRVFNVMIINKNRATVPKYAATTGEAIDAWTGTVQYGRAAPYGSSVDQWVAMVYYLGPS